MAFNHSEVGVVGQTVEKGDDTAGIWKDLVPFLEGSVGRDDGRSMLVTAVEDFIQEMIDVNYISLLPTTTFPCDQGC